VIRLVCAKALTAHIMTTPVHDSRHFRRIQPSSK
jgi:hypothetical protein